VFDEFDAWLDGALKIRYALMAAAKSRQSLDIDFRHTFWYKEGTAPESINVDHIRGVA
jgi:hypothetical protein